METNPFIKFQSWYEKAQNCTEIADASAMCLATADTNGLPSNRMVLLKGYGDDGFVFYTNLERRKCSELEQNPQAALCFYWASLARQIRIEGRTVPVSNDEADSYFGSRLRQSRIGAWASRQSQPIAQKNDLTKAIAKYSMKFAAGDIPRPPHWSGFTLVPERIEFWSEGAFRIHDRLQFTRQMGNNWSVQKLYP